MSLTKLQKSDLIMTVKKEDIEDYRTRLIEEYIPLYISLYPDLKNMVDDPSSYLSKLILPYLEVTIVDIIAYIFTMKLISECDKDSYPGIYPQPKAIRSDIYPNNHNYKRIAYAEMIRGYDEQQICSDERFLHPYSNSSIKTVIYDKLNFNEFDIYLSARLGNQKISSTAYMLTVAMYDLYQYMWERFEDLIGNSETFSKTKISSKLPNIRYIIVEDKYDQLLLYRQVEENVL